MRISGGLALVGAMWAGLSLSASGDDSGANRPATPAEAAGRMTLPEGFKVELFAAEPDVVQPIAFTFDSRGRLWVAECYSYPIWLGGPTGRDRILIFDDQDGDGRFDSRKVFYDQGTSFTGLALGFGGVWVCATPNLLFIPDRDGDDVPDGEPVVKLDGWDVKAQHNMFNALNWAPDGWLWGCNGIMSNSRVGKPGTPDGERVPINCGVWRYHPTREVFEVVAHGTTNPWGLDFDDRGEAFITNCVIPHLYRVVPGAHYQRMYGEDFNKYAFDLMSTCADHIHWAGGSWTDSREGKGRHGEAGGGHAHVGAMIYLGDNWPDRYRDTVFTCNLHGHRVNHDLLSRRGSGFVARHGRDFLLANDTWFRGLELKYGPDGAVYLTDWSDMGECHEADADNAHRENGRIYKISYEGAKLAKVDLARLDDAALVALQLHKNDWYVRQSRRLLQERAASGRDMTTAHAKLIDIFAKNGDATRKLRALWALHVTGGLDEDALGEVLGEPAEEVRSWAVRLLVDGGEPSPATLERFEALARTDGSPLVRLAIASSLRRLPIGRRLPIAAGLVRHAEDAKDADLPLMIWYGIEPVAAAEPGRAAGLIPDCRIALVRQYLARRIALVEKGSSSSRGLDVLAATLGGLGDAEAQRDVLAGILEALRGRNGLARPEGWREVSARLARSGDAEVRERSLLLSLHFGEQDAAKALAAIMRDEQVPTERRRRALRALVDGQIDVSRDLRALLDDPAVRGAALKGLAAFAGGETPRAVLRRYASWGAEDRADAVGTLASRPAYALALLEAVESGTVPRRDLTVSVARQLQGFGDAKISDRLEKAWGSLRPTSKEKAALMSRYKAVLTPDRVKEGDPARGRLVFGRACAQCHKLYDSGGDVGPDLTGSDRANLDYVLENVLDPSLYVGREFKLASVATADGRLVTGIIRAQDDRTLTIQTENDRVLLSREDVEAVKMSDASMMPEGLFEKLSEDEVRDLVSYLATKEQAPLPDGATNGKD